MTFFPAVVTMASTFFVNVAPYSPGEEDVVARDMIEYRTRTGNDFVLYSLTLHPEGRPATNKVAQALASYRRLRRELEGSGVRLGVLLQAILGHWPRVDKDIEPWQRTVDVEGREVRFCILDPRFRDYIQYVGTELAKERPAFVLGDDDIRGHSPWGECFCPLHVAEFNRRTGLHLSGEELRSSVKRGDPFVKGTMEELCREIPLTTSRLLREAIDAVDPSIGAGACMPYWHENDAGAFAKALAGPRHSAVLRIDSGMYNERSAKDFPANVQRMLANLSRWGGEIPVLLDEADTFPHDCYSKSAVSFHSKLVAGLFSGLKGAKLWFVNAHKAGRPVSRKYTDVLSAHRGLYSALVDLVTETRPIGLAIPAGDVLLDCSITDRTPFNPCGETWGAFMAGRFGVPYYCASDFSDPDPVYALMGTESVRRLSDEQLNAMFARKVLLDGGAVLALSKRGFSELMGVKAESLDFRFNSERAVADGRIYPYAKNEKTPFLTTLDGATSLTRLVYSPFEGATPEDVCAGVSVFTNRLGGRVVATAYHPGISYHDRINAPRREWFSRVLDAACGDGFPVQVRNEQDVLALARVGRNGALVVSVWNLGFDPIDDLDLVVRGIRARPVEELRPNGVWGPYEGSSIPCYGVKILRVAK